MPVFYSKITQSICSSKIFLADALIYFQNMKKKRKIMLPKARPRVLKTRGSMRDLYSGMNSTGKKTVPSKMEIVMGVM